MGLGTNERTRTAVQIAFIEAPSTRMPGLLRMAGMKELTIQARDQLLLRAGDEGKRIAQEIRQRFPIKD